jgi:AcrR family transcriptional regulator
VPLPSPTPTPGPPRGSSRPSLRERKKDANRRAIEDAAWDLFAEAGYEATTVNQIAERANVAPRTFFRYFPSKEAVLYTELDGLLAVLAEAFRLRPVDEPPLVSLIEAMAAIDAETSPFMERQRERFMLLKQQREEGAPSFLSERVGAAVADMVRARYADEPDREVRARLAAGVLTTVMTISNEEWLEEGAEGPPHETARRCFDIVRDLIVPHPAPASTSPAPPPRRTGPSRRRAGG